MRELLILIFLICFQLPSFALQEVRLDVSEDNLDEVAEEISVENFANNNLTLQEKIQNIKSKEYTDTTKAYYLLEDILTKKFDNGPLESVSAFGYYRGSLDFDFYPDDTDLKYDFNSINAGLRGKFKDKNTAFEAWFRVNPQHRYSFLQYMPSNFYISNTSIPHHTIMIGNSRTPTGVEGGMSMTNIPFVTRSQIGRNLGNVRKVGVRVKGKYDLVEYDLGGYDSDTYFRSFFPGAEFSGWVNLKPLGKTDGRYGKLTLGSGITTGHNDINYFVYGAYVGYEYKKFTADFEYAKANGYNGSSRISPNHAQGFTTTLGYKITPKLQVVTRYDQFVPDQKKSKDIKREYSAGINYFIKGQALKVMLNYVFCQNDLSKDSHRILIGTQILL